MEEFKKYKKNYLEPFKKNSINEIDRTTSISSIDTSSSSSGEEKFCCICFDCLSEKNILILTSCEHKFHIECIKKWLFEKNFCPLCKSDQSKLRKRFHNIN
jgi:hypothetical protein